MPGGSIQLDSIGSENSYINGRPEINFFKQVYMRHTNFVCNMVEILPPYNDNLSFNKPTSLKIKIPRNGDLINKVFLKIDLPSIVSGYKDNEGFRFIDNIGSMIIKSAKLMIENTVIQDLTGDFIHIHNTMYNSSETTKTINAISGHTRDINNPRGNLDNAYRSVDNTLTRTANGEEYLNKNYKNMPTIKAGTLNIPLPFWFCNNKGLALPLIAMRYHTVYIDIELRPIRELVTIIQKESIESLSIDRFYQKAPNSDFDISQFIENGGSWNINAKLDINYIFLDNYERDNLVKNSSVFLIEQTQYRTVKNITGTNFIEMELYHPVKEIFIFARKTNVYNTNEWTNYSNNDYIDQQYKNYQNNYLKEAGSFQNLGQFMLNGNTTHSLITDHNQPPYTIDDILNLSDIWKTRSHNNIPVIDKHNYKFFTKDIIKDITILFDGYQRMEKKNTDFYNNSQAYMYHSNNLDNVLKYSFSKNPEAFQPFGSCNFSEMNKLGFNINVKNPMSESGLNTEDYGYDLHFLFVNYNILDVRNGMAGIVYGNN